MAQEGSRGVTVKDVAAQDFVIAYAAHLKRIGKIEVPKWADLVKTAAFKELAPYDQDWYYIRAGGPWPSRDSPPCCVQPMQHRALRLCRAVGGACAALPAWPRSAGHATALCQTCAGRLPVAQKHGLGGWVGRACDHPHSPCLVADAPLPRVLRSGDRAPGVLAGRRGCGRFQEDLRRPRAPWHEAREVRDRLRSHRPAHPQAARGAEDRRAHPGGQGGPPQGVRRRPVGGPRWESGLEQPGGRAGPGWTPGGAAGRGCGHQQLVTCVLGSVGAAGSGCPPGRQRAPRQLRRFTPTPAPHPVSHPAGAHALSRHAQASDHTAGPA